MRCLLVLSVVVATGAFAGPKKKHWGEWAVGGDCHDGNTRFIENGDSLAILYDKPGMSMPARQTGDGLEIKRGCTFRIDVHPPAGLYLAEIRQVYSGGLIKSRQAAAHMNARYRIGNHREKALDLDWKHGQAVPPESPASLFSKAADDVVPFEECRKRQRLALTLVVTAKRKGLDEFVVGGFDSADLQFVHRVAVRPVFRPCR